MFETVYLTLCGVRWSISRNEQVIIMKHIFRLNVYQKGYTLFSGRADTQFLEHPLDVWSDNLPQNYLPAQKRIDDLLKLHHLRWHFCIANMHRGQNPVVAYGTLLPIKDEKGRRGVSYIHAIEANEEMQVDDIVISLAKLLSLNTSNFISQALANIAQGEKKPDSFMQHISEQFLKLHSSYHQHTFIEKPIKEIQHDCGGASIVAWLAMATSHLMISPVWEIYDMYHSEGGFFSTVSSLEDAKEKWMLSKYLHQVVYEHEILHILDTLHSTPIEKAVDTKKNTATETEQYSNQAKIPNTPINTASFIKNKYHFENKERVCNDSNIQTHQYDEIHQFKSSVQEFPLSSGTIIVEWNGLYNGELILIDRKENREYKIRLHNGISCEEKKDYYIITFKKHHLLVFSKTVKLILTKESLTEQQRQQMRQFKAVI